MVQGRYEVRKYGDKGYAAFDTVTREKDIVNCDSRSRAIFRATELDRVALTQPTTGMLAAALAVTNTLEALIAGVRVRNMLARDYESLEGIVDGAMSNIAALTDEYFGHFLIGKNQVANKQRNFAQVLRQAQTMLLMSFAAVPEMWHAPLDVDGPVAASIRYCIFPGAAKPNANIPEQAECPRDLLIVGYSGQDAAARLEIALERACAEDDRTNVEILYTLLPIRAFASEGDGYGFAPHRALRIAEKKGQDAEHTWRRYGPVAA